jgi:hypothetical protein
VTLTVDIFMDFTLLKLIVHVNLLLCFEWLLPPSSAVVIKSGNLNFLEPSGPLQACNGTALLLSGNHLKVKKFGRRTVQFSHSISCAGAFEGSKCLLCAAEQCDIYIGTNFYGVVFLKAILLENNFFAEIGIPNMS